MILKSCCSGFDSILLAFAFYLYFEVCLLDLLAKLNPLKLLDLKLDI